MISKVHFKVHLGLYSLIPFLVLAISNFGLIYVLYYKKKSLTSRKFSSTSEKKDKHDRRMNLTVLLMTFLFILMTFPIAMASFFFERLSTTNYGNFIIILVDFISFCYHGLSFIIMIFTNKIFYKECLKVFGVKKSSSSNRFTSIANARNLNC